MIVAIAVLALVVGVTIGWFSFWFLEPAGGWRDLQLSAARKERDTAREALREMEAHAAAIAKERDALAEKLRGVER